MLDLAALLEELLHPPVPVLGRVPAFAGSRTLIRGSADVQAMLCSPKLEILYPKFHLHRNPQDWDAVSMQKLCIVISKNGLNSIKDTLTRSSLCKQQL